MNRTMPGPPEDWWYCTPPHGEPGLCTSDMDPAEYMPFTHLQHKRLTDAEAAAEYWQAEVDARDHAIAIDYGVAPDHDMPVLAAATWHRFATHPHALEVDA